MSIDQYSASPASNDLANYFQTGMRPSAVKTAGWDIMADLKDNLWAWPTVGGTANAITLTNQRTVGGTNPFNGEMHWFIPTAANTGAATLKVDSQTNAKNVFAYGAALLGGELQPNVPALVKYDGTQWQLLNPQDATGSFTITLTGFTTTVAGLINWRIVKGKTVYFWYTSSINGTSNSGGMTGTGIPVAIQPATLKRISPAAIQDNGTGVAGNIQIPGGSSTWTFGNSFTNSAMTNGAGKGLSSTGSIYSYTLD